MDEKKNRQGVSKDTSYTVGQIVSEIHDESHRQGVSKQLPEPLPSSLCSLHGQHDYRYERLNLAGIDNGSH
jgi:hypothetical protein